MKKFGLIGLFLLTFSGIAHAQGYQCRTSPAGTSTPNCASEAFVTQSSARGPSSSTAGDIPSFSDTSGKILQDSGIPSTSLPTSGGNTGQQLVSNGGSNHPTFQSGGWVLLNTLTASNSATLSDTSSITSTYNEYILVFENVLPVTNNVNCELQVHTGGAFPATSYVANSLRMSSTTLASITSPTTFIPCDSDAGSLQNTGTGLSGEITLYNASQTASPKSWAGLYNENNTALSGMVAGSYNGANTAIDGFRVLMSSGNITSGTIKVYGRQ